MSAGCGVDVTAYTGKWSEREITVKCGNTSPYGTPYQCEACERKNRNRDWRKEAEDAGERWDDDY